MPKISGAPAGRRALIHRQTPAHASASPARAQTSTAGVSAGFFFGVTGETSSATNGECAILSMARSPLQIGSRAPDVCSIAGPALCPARPIPAGKLVSFAPAHFRSDRPVQARPEAKCTRKLRPPARTCQYLFKKRLTHSTPPRPSASSAAGPKNRTAPVRYQVSPLAPGVLRTAPGGIETPGASGPRTDPLSRVGRDRPHRTGPGRLPCRVDRMPGRSRGRGHTRPIGVSGPGRSGRRQRVARSEPVAGPVVPPAAVAGPCRNHPSISRPT